MKKLRDLATKYPNIQIVVDHTGLPMERSEEYFANWKQGVVLVSEADNVWWKKSGLGMADNNWPAESNRPYVMHSVWHSTHVLCQQLASGLVVQQL